MKKYMVLASIVTMVAILVSACGQATTPAAPAAAPTTAPAAPTGLKILRLGRGTYPDVLDPQKSSYGIEIEILKLTYEGLLAIDEKGNIGPGGADKWDFVSGWHQDDVPHPRRFGALGWHPHHRGRL